MSEQVIQQPAIEVDDNDETDSAAGDLNVRNSTSSVNSSVLRYREENGRTYHGSKEGKYPFPNDEPENDRLDLQHHMFLMTLDNKLAMAPIGRNAQRVLDVGTGSGIWAMDFADERSESQVVGIDHSPIQPGFLPPNLIFEIDDLEADWTFSEPFDYIHSRMMLRSFADWPRFFKQCFDNLKPGGYIELQEGDFCQASIDNSTPADSDLTKWINLMVEAAEKAGRPLNMATRFKGMLERLASRTSKFCRTNGRPIPGQRIRNLRS